jgi:type IV pilus assembly protein PilW
MKQTATGRAVARGFTLVELMIALAIGLLLVAGIGSLFYGVNRSNAMQERLATLHEGGRFAVNRLEQDLRMASNQYCSNFAGSAHTGTVAPMWSERAPTVFARLLNPLDLAGGLPDSGGMQSVNPTTGARSNAEATATYALSPRFFMQGYRCTTGNACTPALPSTSMFPQAGNVVNRRVPNSDILTIRYMRGTGWPVTSPNTDCEAGDIVRLTPFDGDDPVPTEMTLAYISDCRTPALLPIQAISGNTLTLGSRLGTGATRPLCGRRTQSASGTLPVRLFDFSNDFVTVTYYLAYRLDDDPTARPNSGTQRLVPVLIRRENGVEQELVRGVERLQFTFGVQDRLGNMRFMSAPEVDNRLGNTVNCPLKALGIPPDPAVQGQQEPGCLWRAVRRIEARMVVNGVSDVETLEDAALAYTFNGATITPTPTTALPSGLPHMRTPRREFVAAVSLKGLMP